MILTVFAFAGCTGEQLNGPQGDTGAQGPQGNTGAQGPQGVQGPAGQDASHIEDIAELLPDQLAELKPAITVTNVNLSGSQPVVSFTVKSALGYGVKGLGAKSGSNLSYMRFGLAKLVAGTNDSPEHWESYMITGTSKAPTLERSGTIVDNGDGTYVYTFATMVVSGNTNTFAPAYDASATTRLAILLSDSNKAFTPVNYTNDFVPAGGTASQREIVLMASCMECHSRFSFHGESRQDPKICVMCHTAQRGNGATASAPDGTGTFTDAAQSVINGMTQTELVTFVHKIHSGKELALKNYTVGGLLLNEITFPQDIRNCKKCHTGAQGDNWKTKPSRKACGSCHDNISWDSSVPTGFVAHSNGAKTDSQCAGCHDADNIVSAHIAVVPPDPNNSLNGGTNSNTNAAYLAAAGAVPPGAAVITYDIKSVSRDVNKNPVIVFKLMKDGTDVVFNTYVAGSVTEIMTNFVGSPSVYFAFAVPEDGITAPADFNATASGYIKKIWDGTATGTGAGTISGPDGSGYYTITLTGAFVPDNAVMLTGGMGYSYSLSSAPPLVQTNLSEYPYNATTKQGGLIVPAPNVWKVATGYTGRRSIVSTAKCNACHAALGVAPTYHAGQRNDGPTCSFCHTPNRTSSGWAANAKDEVHAIHGAAYRNKAFNWHATSATEGFWDITYPGILNNCEACHLAGAYDFSASAYTANDGALIGNLLMSTAASGTINAGISVSPYVVAGTNYGSGFSFNVGTQATTTPADTTLVHTPISSACFACHDSTAAVAHMRANGGAIYAARSSALTTVEQCLICHGPGRTAAIADVHKVQ